MPSASFPTQQSPPHLSPHKETILLFSTPRTRPHSSPTPLTDSQYHSHNNALQLPSPNPRSDPHCHCCKPSLHDNTSLHHQLHLPPSSTLQRGPLHHCRSPHLQCPRGSSPRLLCRDMGSVVWHPRCRLRVRREIALGRGCGWSSRMLGRGHSHRILA